LQKAAGRLCAGLLRFAEAKKYLEAVHARDTSDAEVSYYLGLAYDALGETLAARGAFDAAHLMPEFKASGALRLGELAARAGDLNQSESYLQEALRAAPDDVRTAEELAAVRRAMGKPGAREFAQEWLARFPQSYFLREQLPPPDLSHLANDVDRVLNVAALYMRLGIYQPALDVLLRTYPDAVPDETEPGSLPPRLHPLVAYFRAYCMEKLGQPASAAYQGASKLSTAYVFPSSAQELEVLQAALRENPQDGPALYLLGTLYFSRGLTEEALAEWNAALKFSPGLPVLHASLGRVLLQAKHDPGRRSRSFATG